MRTLISPLQIIVTLATIVAFVATPYAALAQTWQPPQGPPPGNNTYFPVHIGPNDQFNNPQTKIGGLDILGEFGVGDRSTFGDRATFGDEIIVLGNATFDGNVGIGDTGLVPPRIFSIYGGLTFLPHDASGNLLPTNQDWVIASDANGNARWADPASIFTGGTPGNLPAGADGQTMWYNDTTNAWEAFDRIKLVPANSFTGTPERLKVTHSEVMVDGNLNIGNPDMVGFNPSTAPANNQNLAINSTNVNFQPPPGAPQNVRFSNSNVEFFDAGTTPNGVKFSGSQNNPGEGYTPASASADGTFRWSSVLQNETIGNANVVSINPDASASSTWFWNEGYSMFRNDITVEDSDIEIEGYTSDLFIEDIDQEFDGDPGANQLVSLCWNPSTGRVVNCNTVGAATGNNVLLNAPLLLTDTISGSYTFTIDDQVDIELCGSGGGGGGGGAGQEFDNSNGVGGGGGGGGNSGECININDQNVNAGDTLVWTMAGGGSGGMGGRYGVPLNFSPALSAISVTVPSVPGSSGSDSIAELVSGGQITQTWLANGGTGGNASNNAVYPVPSLGGAGGAALSGNFNFWWNNGGDGAGTTLPAGSNGNNSSCARCGANGGDGISSNGNISGDSTPSAGGNGGLPNQTTATDAYGGNGRTGSVKSGGGGGGGAAGYWAGGQTGGYFAISAGGNGGPGGPGQITITGTTPLDPNAQPPQIEFENTGHFSLADIPNYANLTQITIEAWGAGGTGATAAPGPNRCAGSGGAGAYGRVIVPMSSLDPNEAYTVNIGAGGTYPGTGDGGASSVVAFTSGQNIISVNGGGEANGINPGSGGSGGSGSGIFLISGDPGGQGFNGIGCAIVQGAQGIQGFGSGGNGARIGSGIPGYAPQPGKKGRVLVTW